MRTVDAAMNEMLSHFQLQKLTMTWLTFLAMSFITF